MSGKNITKERRMFASRMLEIRESAGLTQAEMARILGISLSAYKKVEKGEIQLSTDNLKRAGDELGISADYLLFGERPDMTLLWEKIEKCSDEEKEMILKNIFRYFTKVQKTVLLTREEQQQRDDKLEEYLQQMDPFWE